MISAARSGSTGTWPLRCWTERSSRHVSPRTPFRHLMTVYLNRRQLEAILDKIFFVSAANQLRISRDLLFLMALSVRARIMGAQRHFDIASAIRRTERSVEVRL